MADKTLEQAREIFQTVRLLQERLVRQFDRIQKESAQEGICTDLTFPQCNAMMVIHERGVVTIKELSAALQVSSPSASTMVDRLVEMGMLLREQSKSDRREVAVRLSESGKRSIQFMEEQFLASIQGLLYLLGAEFSQQWCDIYQHIRYSLKAAAEIDAIDAQEALDSQRQA